MAISAVCTPSLAADVEVQIPSGQIILSGTLSLPEVASTVPGVVLISGSGPSDRNESMPGISMKPFELLASQLSASGIAVLRYDDRGVGQSDGDFLSATSLDFAEDATAAVAYLAGRPEIDPDAIGVIGHSEGGMVAPMVAILSTDLDFIVTLAGPAVPGYELIAEQLRVTAADLPEADRGVAYQAWTRLLDQVVASDWPAAEADLRAQYEAMRPEQQAELGGLEAFTSRSMIYNRGWLHFFVTHDPADDWREVTLPVLALYGERDVVVSADINAAALATALDGNADATILRMPTANHLFQDAVTGAVSEYPDLPAEFVSDLPGRIAVWIDDR